MANLGNFNAREVPPSKPFEPLPAGTYEAIISASEDTPTKNGNGSYLKLEFTIISGEHQNRKLFDRLNLNNPSDQAVAIARAQLSAICHAVERLDVKDSSQLHDLPLLIVVKQGKDDKGNITNEIKGYKSVKDGKPTTAQPGTKASGPGAVPWAKK